PWGRARPLLPPPLARSPRRAGSRQRDVLPHLLESPHLRAEEGLPALVLHRGAQRLAGLAAAPPASRSPAAGAPGTRGRAGALPLGLRRGAGRPAPRAALGHRPRNPGASALRGIAAQGDRAAPGTEPGGRLYPTVPGPGEAARAGGR